MRHWTERSTTRLLVQLAAVPAAGGLTASRVLAATGLANAGVSPVELKELVYHAVPYVDVAWVFYYLHAVNNILTAAGVELPLPLQATSTPETRQQRGHQVQIRIVGAGRVPRCTPTPQEWRTVLTSAGTGVVGQRCSHRSSQGLRAEHRITRRRLLRSYLSREWVNRTQRRWDPSAERLIPLIRFA